MSVGPPGGAAAVFVVHIRRKSWFGRLELVMEDLGHVLCMMQELGIRTCWTAQNTPLAHAGTHLHFRRELSVQYRPSVVSRTCLRMRWGLIIWGDILDGPLKFLAVMNMPRIT